MLAVSCCIVLFSLTIILLPQFLQQTVGTDAVCAQQHASLHSACLCFLPSFSTYNLQKLTFCHGRAKDMPPVELPSTYRRSEPVGKHSPLGPSGGNFQSHSTYFIKIPDRSKPNCPLHGLSTSPDRAQMACISSPKESVLTMTNLTLSTNLTIYKNPIYVISL